MNTPHKLSARALRPLLLACACLLAAGTRAPAGAQGQPVPASADSQYGIDLFKSGNTQGAIKALRDATKKDAANADAWYYLGLAFVKDRKPKEARKAFEATLRLRPTFVAANNGLAYALLTERKVDEARRAVENSLRIEPRNAEAHYLLGAIHMRSNSFDKSLEEAEAALKIDGDYSVALYLKIESLLGIGGAALSGALLKPPGERPALLEKSKASMDEAMAALEKYVKLNPQSPHAAELREQIDTVRVYSAGQTQPPAVGDDIYPASDVATRAVIKDRPDPLYTPKARENGTTGTVRLRMLLAADGTVKYIFAVHRLPDGLTEAAINAARKIKFTPAVKDGRPVSQYVTIDYNFNIY
jgi:TonB family protein